MTTNMSKDDYLLLARRAHNEKAGYHPNSAKYAELQAQVSEYTKLAYACDELS